MGPKYLHICAYYKREKKDEATFMRLNDKIQNSKVNSRQSKRLDRHGETIIKYTICQLRTTWRVPGSPADLHPN